MKKRGSYSVEVVVASLFIIPVFLGAITGSFAYFTASAYNSNLNFDTGRYVASCGCSYSQLENAFSGRKFENYAVTYKDGYRNIQLKGGDAGEIIVNCPWDAKKGSEFTIETYTTNYAPFFPDVNYKRNFYVQEVK